MKHIYILYYFILFCVSLIYFSFVLFQSKNFLSSVSYLLRGLFLVFVILFLSELSLMYTIINISNSSNIIKSVINFTLFSKMLLALYMIYIGINFYTAFKFNRSVIIVLIIFLSVYSIVMSIWPLRYVSSIVNFTKLGKIFHYLEMLLKALGVVLLFIKREDFRGNFSILKHLFIVSGLFFLYELYRTLYLNIFNQGYELYFHQSILLIFQVLFTPGLFIFLCIKTRETVFNREEKKQFEIESYGLSNKESEVLILILKGLNNKDIEDNLCIAKSTLKTHINRIFSKVGVKTRLELIYKFIN